MADSQSRYSIIDELTEKMNRETENIAIFEKQVKDAEDEMETAKSRYEFDARRAAEDFDLDLADRERKLASLRETNDKRVAACKDKISQLEKAVESLKQISKEGAKAEQK